MPDPLLLLGPFCDADLLVLVTGRPDTAKVPARRADNPGTAAAGCLVAPDATTADRLRFFAAVHGITPRRGTARLEDGTERAADVIALSGQALGGQVFSDPLPDRWLQIWRAAAPEIMGCLGTQTPQTVQSRLRMIWSRADSRLRGASGHHPSLGGFDQRNVRIASVERPYAKFFVVEDYVYSHDRFDGTDSGPLDRAVFVGADAVTVLPYDPVRDRVLLVEQIRAAPLARADPQPWLLEPVAGRIEPGDSPETTAHREALEEAGVTLTALHPITGYYPTTAAFSEYIFSYIGIADLPDDAAGLGGLETEAEDIKGHLMPRDALMQRIAAGQIQVGPLLISAYWLALNLDSLRQSG
jgi:nudix-type nucleoside diphosphatase (YffH/AdpP family)